MNDQRVLEGLEEAQLPAYLSAGVLCIVEALRSDDDDACDAHLNTGLRFLARASERRDGSARPSASAGRKNIKDTSVDTSGRRGKTRGNKRKCPECGETKAPQGFRGDGDTCTKCQRAEEAAGESG